MKCIGVLTDIGDELLHFDVGSDANEELEFGIGSPEPEDDDQDREDQGTHGIDPPSQLTSSHGCEDTEAVDEKVISMVFPEDSDLGILVSQCPAICKEKKLCDKSNADSNH